MDNTKMIIIRLE